jgi:hypothetical protein
MPEPPPPSEELIRMLSDFDLSVGELALGLREIVLKEAPTAVEKLFRVYALVFSYSFSGKMSEAFCQVVIYPKGVNLMFNRGAELDDADGVLVGDGKIIRHIKVRKPEDLRNKYLRSFIRASLKNARRIEKEKRLASLDAPAKTTRTSKSRRTPATIGATKSASKSSMKKPR